MYNRQFLYLVDFRSTTLGNMNRKPLGLFWLFQPSTADITIRKTTTSITFRHVANKLGNWVAHVLKSQSYEDYTVRRSLPTFTEHVIPTKHGKFVIIIRKQTKITKTSQIPSRNSICHLINQLYKKYINKKITWTKRGGGQVIGSCVGLECFPTYLIKRLSSKHIGIFMQS